MLARVLIDNKSRDSLIPEWGLSFYIEYEGHKILLDTGASEKFLKNADAMGVRLEETEFGVLSHAHYDHSDGMGAFFARNTQAPFYLRYGAEENCYGKKKYFYHYNGIHRGFLKKYQDRIVYVKGDYEVIPGVTLVPHKTEGLEEIAKSVNLYVKKGLWWKPDSFAHEQSLVFDTAKGLVIFNSCSHGGADNIIREVAATWPGKQIYALLGGFHLYKSSETEIQALAKNIRETGIQKIYTGHCTGDKAFDILKKELGDQAEQLYSGMEINL